jgi:hypothetical protein
VAPEFLDRGKTAIKTDYDSSLWEAIDTSVTKVTDEWRRRKMAEERDAKRKQRRQEQVDRILNRPDYSLKEAVTLALPTAIEEASAGGEAEFSGRDFYYVTRQMIQEYTHAKLTQSYFDDVVKEWEVDHGIIENMMRKPRGFAVEPHTKTQIPLGTKAVGEYEIPAHLYETILFFEKTGLYSRLQWGQVAERFDALLLLSEGYAVKAAKALIDAAQRGGHMKVLCFHDADPHGYNIARTLSEATGAHRYAIKIIDAGLHLQDAIDLGLPTETFERSKELPRELELSDLEREYFTGIARKVIDRSGNRTTKWIGCQRVELNALSSNPRVFVDWLEHKLKERGVYKKLVPPNDAIREQVADRSRVLLREHVQRRVDEALNVDAIIEEVCERIGDGVKVRGPVKSVKNWAKDITPRHWTHHVDDRVTEAVTSLDDKIITAVADEIKKMAEGGGAA